ncbi:MAG: hypothetical protein WCO22_10335 [Betaproteobacteria bacterium]|jgi:hypothetical protein
MKFNPKIVLLALTVGVLPLAAQAGDSGAVYGQVGTNGLGLGYSTSVGEDWAARAQINALKTSFSGNVGDFGANAKLNVDVNLQSIQFLADWYPSASGFRLSGGVVVNNNKVTLTGTGKVAGKDATVNGELKMNDGLSPYLGLGYATRPKDAKGLGFNVDLGVLFQNPKASLSANGAGVTQADINAQLKTMQDAADNLKLFPILGLGVSYAF